MNIRKDIDYSAMFNAMDDVMAAGMTQMELYCELGRLICTRPEKGAAVAAAEHFKNRYQDVNGFSPRNMRRMRDFYRLYGEHSDLLALSLKIGWTQNVIILEFHFFFRLNRFVCLRFQYACRADNRNIRAICFL